MTCGDELFSNEVESALSSYLFSCSRVPRSPRRVHRGNFPKMSLSTSSPAAGLAGSAATASPRVSLTETCALLTKAFDFDTCLKQFIIADGDSQNTKIPSQKV